MVSQKVTLRMLLKSKNPNPTWVLLGQIFPWTSLDSASSYLVNSHGKKQPKNDFQAQACPSPVERGYLWLSGCTVAPAAFGNRIGVFYTQYININTLGLSCRRPTLNAKQIFRISFHLRRAASLFAAGFISLTSFLFSILWLSLRFCLGTPFCFLIGLKVFVLDCLPSLEKNLRIFCIGTRFYL